MPTFSSSQIPPPRNWQDFEDLCCDLWSEIWKDPNAQKNGRQGQAQHGVDVFGRPNQEEKWAGVQCKGKDNYADKSLTEDEINREVEKAQSFEPALTEFIIATTGPKDATVEKLARKITEDHLNKGLFTVYIWAWEDIKNRLVNYPRVIEKHHPEWAGAANTEAIRDDIDQIKKIMQQKFGETVEEIRIVNSSVEYLPHNPLPNQPNYNWKRFWSPREGHINLFDGGYLVNPDAERGHIYNPDVISLGSIAERPCLVLLGEPGMGKTTAMQMEWTTIESKMKASSDEAIWFDLRSYGSEDRLVRNLFEGTDFVSWTEGHHQLHLFLDSLDECLLRIDTLASLLVDELKKYPVSRLSLRIACRTGDWPSCLEDGLKQLWDKDAVGVYELAPLRRVDVSEAARTWDLPTDRFLDEIDQKAVVPLAIKPLTLNTISIFKCTYFWNQPGV